MTTLTQDVIAYLIDCAIGNREFAAVVRESATRDPDGSIMRNNFIYAVTTGEVAESVPLFHRLVVAKALLNHVDWREIRDFFSGSSTTTTSKES